MSLLKRSMKIGDGANGAKETGGGATGLGFHAYVYADVLLVFVTKHRVAQCASKFSPSCKQEVWFASPDYNGTQTSLSGARPSLR